METIYDKEFKKILVRAAAALEIPQLENLKYSLEDRGASLGTYSMCYHKNFPEYADFCGPDKNFGGWMTIGVSSFEKARDNICAAAATHAPTINKVGWLGNFYSADETVPEHYTRPILKEYGDKYPEIFDFVHIFPQGSLIHAGIPGYKSLADLTQYKYLIDIGGNGWSGRLKWLLFTRRTLFVVDRNYIDYFFNDLKPFVHYIPVKMDLTDLLKQFMWAVNNPERAAEIAENARQFADANFTEEKINARILFVYNNLLRYNNNTPPP
jgi:hypothetical protein